MKESGSRNQTHSFPSVKNQITMVKLIQVRESPRHYLSKPKTENKFQGKSLSRVTLQSIGKLTKWKIDRGEIEMTNRQSFNLPCVEPFPGNI